MNAAGNNRLLNSLIPQKNVNVGVNNRSPMTNSGSSGSIIGFTIFIFVVLAFVAVLYFFKEQIQSGWDNLMSYFQNAQKQDKGQGQGQGQTPVTNPSPPQGEVGEPPSPSALSIVEKILPGGKEVFSISSNKYTYYDAEPLCKALGAELATYDQVKEAWAKGADWCNYGWIKGQMAVYPTSDETYKKLQDGPAEQRLACGRPGINGGHFDNPELRFGATCYGAKPPQSKHDEERAAMATPVSPDALAFDKKVAQFKTEADSVGILPFNTKAWND